MKNNCVRLFAFILMLAMLVSAFAACGGEQGESSESESSEITENTTDNSETSEETQTTEETESDTKEQDTEEQDTEGETEYEITSLDTPHSDQILLADKLANEVQAYYSDPIRSSMIVENLEMIVEYGLVPEYGQQVLALKNSKGVSYVENTMDVFLRMTDGNTYYASASDRKATSNLYRIGYSTPISV